MSGPFTIAIYNPISGSGSTTIAANLSALIQRKMPSSFLSLVDGDLFFPSLQYYFPSDANVEIPVVVQMPLINRKNCNLCNACAKVCHFNALRIRRNAGFIQFDEKNCISCGACFNTCRYDAISLVDHKPGNICNRRIYSNASLVQAFGKVPERFAIPMIWQMKQQTVNSNICIIDVKPGRSAESREAIYDSDILLLVIDAFSFSERYCSLLLPKLCHLANNCAFIINRVSGKTVRYHSFASTFGLPVIAELPFDNEMHWYTSEAGLAVEKSEQWNDCFENLLESINKYMDK